MKRALKTIFSVAADDDPGELEDAGGLGRLLRRGEGARVAGTRVEHYCDLEGSASPEDSRAPQAARHFAWEEVLFDAERGLDAPIHWDGIIIRPD